MERHPKKIGQTTARGVPNGTENDPKSNQIRSQIGPPIAPETLRGAVGPLRRFQDASGTLGGRSQDAPGDSRDALGCFWDAPGTLPESLGPSKIDVQKTFVCRLDFITILEWLWKPFWEVFWIQKWL